MFLLTYINKKGQEQNTLDPKQQHITINNRSFIYDFMNNNYSI